MNDFYLREAYTPIKGMIGVYHNGNTKGLYAKMEDFLELEEIIATLQNDIERKDQLLASANLLIEELRKQVHEAREAANAVILQEANETRN